jgi:hypothetical protein
MKEHRSALTERDSTSPGNPRAAAGVVTWGLAAWATVWLAAAVLERRPTMLALAQAALAEWGAGRAGVAWSDPLASVASGRTDVRSIGRRVGRGAALGGAAAIAVVGLALAIRAAAASPVPPNVALLAVGLIASGLAAVRDELLLRGIVLRATRGLFPTWACLLVCGAAAAAARFGVDGAVTVAMVADALRGMALGAVWVLDRGAWMACAANASWTWTLGSLARGGLLDVRFGADPDGQTGTIVVLAAAALAATISIRGRQP